MNKTKQIKKKTPKIFETKQMGELGRYLGVSRAAFPTLMAASIRDRPTSVFIGELKTGTGESTETSLQCQEGGREGRRKGGREEGREGGIIEEGVKTLRCSLERVFAPTSALPGLRKTHSFRTQETLKNSKAKRACTTQ